MSNEVKILARHLSDASVVYDVAMPGVDDANDAVQVRIAAVDYEHAHRIAHALIAGMSYAEVDAQS